MSYAMAYKLSALAGGIIALANLDSKNLVDTQAALSDCGGLAEMIREIVDGCDCETVEKQSAQL